MQVRKVVHSHHRAFLEASRAVPELEEGVQQLRNYLFGVADILELLQRQGRAQGVEAEVTGGGQGSGAQVGKDRQGQGAAAQGQGRGAGAGLKEGVRGETTAPCYHIYSY